MPILWTDEPEPEADPPRPCDRHTICQMDRCHCVDTGRVAEYLIAVGYRPAQINRTATSLRR